MRTPEQMGDTAGGAKGRVRPRKERRTSTSWAQRVFLSDRGWRRWP